VLSANAEPAAPAASRVPVSAAPLRRHVGHRGSGNVVVDIPPTVFIRLVGPWLLVTTNTGAPPSPADTFELVAHNHASIADASVQHQVETGCASS
jgi:hypothetical protein